MLSGEFHEKSIVSGEHEQDIEGSSVDIEPTEDETLHEEVIRVLTELGKRAIDSGEATWASLTFQDIGRDLSRYNQSDRGIKWTGHNTFAEYYNQSKGE